MLHRFCEPPALIQGHRLNENYHTQTKALPTAGCSDWVADELPRAGAQERHFPSDPARSEAMGPKRSGRNFLLSEAEAILTEGSEAGSGQPLCFLRCLLFWSGQGL